MKNVKSNLFMFVLLAATIFAVIREWYNGEFGILTIIAIVVIIIAVFLQIQTIIEDRKK